MRLVYAFVSDGNHRRLVRNFAWKSVPAMLTSAKMAIILPGPVLGKVELATADEELVLAELFEVELPALLADELEELLVELLLEADELLEDDEPVDG